jgi:hypothetical protein
MLRRIIFEVTSQEDYIVAPEIGSRYSFKKSSQKHLPTTGG